MSNAQTVATRTEPIVRARVHLAHTLKDGWRVDEVTAEVTIPLSDCEQDKLAILLSENLHAAWASGKAEVAVIAAMERQTVGAS